MSTEYVRRTSEAVIFLMSHVQAIDFAKEQNDDDLWEDLLQYSETRPGTFLLDWLLR